MTASREHAAASSDSASDVHRVLPRVIELRARVRGMKLGQQLHRRSLSSVVRPAIAVETAAVLARAPSHAVPGDC